MFVGDLLDTKGRGVVSVPMNATVETAARLLMNHRIGGVVVKDSCGTEGEALVGIFTERDIVRAVSERGAAGLKTQVADLMTRNTIVCSVDDTLDYVRELMDSRRIRHVPVLDDTRLVGILSIRDIVAYDVRRARTANESKAAAMGASPTHA
ncbi:MAG TPA: CBS domain-containing protein [Xanthobacteraceae bacterium]|nr:CBS domain-containing protein [Xanthobacteraceae bacterium]